MNFKSLLNISSSEKCRSYVQRHYSPNFSPTSERELDTESELDFTPVQEIRKSPAIRMQSQKMGNGHAAQVPCDVPCAVLLPAQRLPRKRSPIELAVTNLDNSMPQSKLRGALFTAFGSYAKVKVEKFASK